MGIVAGWLNRQQQAVIEYLKTENEILKSQFHGRRPRLTDGERRRLAVKGKALGRKMLSEIACVVTPETILAWHRRLVALKWTFPRRGVGRPPIANEIRALILELARTDSHWGYTSIQDRLRNLGHRVKSRDGGQCPEGTRPGTGAETPPPDDVVDFLEGALAGVGRD